MTLPLPYTITDQTPLGAAIQSNFEEIAKQFPLSRRNLKVESPHEVGATGEPAFQNGWINYDTAAFQGARFWKDPMGIVHLEGLVKLGTVSTVPMFTLPAGYRPGLAHVFIVSSNNSTGRLDVGPDGLVVPKAPSTNAYISLSGVSFRQER